MVGCVRCVNGYTGLIEQDYFIKECQVMTSCSSDFSEGFSKDGNKLFSCQECVDSG